MKKLVAFLLCLMMVLSLFSCRTPDQENNGTNDQKDIAAPDQPTDGSNDQPTGGETDQWLVVIDKPHYKIEMMDWTRIKYYIYDSDKNMVLFEEIDSLPEITMLGDHIVKILIGRGLENPILKYYDVENNRFSDEYSYVAASSGNLVAYMDTSMEGPTTNRLLVIRDIFDKQVFYKSFRYDSDGNLVLSEGTDSLPTVSVLGGNIVDICMDTETEIGIHKYYDAENGRFSDEYTHIVASSGNLVAYIDTSAEDPMANRLLVIRDMFDNRAFYKSFQLDFSTAAHDPIESATFTDGEVELEVVYLSEGSPASLSVTIPLRRAAADGEPLSQNEIAIQMYEAAIRDEIFIIDERAGEIKLKDLCFASNDTALKDRKILTKAILDVDLDGVNEYLIQSPDYEHIILRFYNGKVYSYCLDSCDYYRFNADGTFYWYEPIESEGRTCGRSKIVFAGETLNIKPMYSLKYSKNAPAYEYFVEGEAVTGYEYDIYRYYLPSKENVKFSQFELMCSYPITAEQAWNLANEYWDYHDGCDDGSAGSIWISRIVLIDVPNSETDYYRVAFREESYTGGALEGYECMPPSSIREYDQILVNAFTGEITTPACEAGNEAISIEEAMEIAIHHEGTSYYAEYDATIAAPDHIYVIVFYDDADHHDYRTSVWVDKYTGEIVSGYYLWGK